MDAPNSFGIVCLRRFVSALTSIVAMAVALSAFGAERSPSLQGPPATGLAFTKVSAGPLDTLRQTILTAAWGDYDGDQRPDLFVAADTLAQGELYRNTPTGFERVTTGRVTTDMAQRTSAAWGDLDNDGALDLFVANNAGSLALLYRNQGDGTLESLVTGPALRGGLSLSTLWFDYDSDGLLDLFVANGGGARAEPNFLYNNAGNRSLVATTTPGVTSDFEYSQGSSAADYDGDGDLDLLVINLFGSNALYRNDRNGVFTRTVSGEVGTRTSPLGGTSSAWGDYDNDGDLDLVIITGGSVNILYRNDGGILVRDTVSPISNTGSESAGAAWADLNNDGALDLIIPSRAGGALVFEGDGTGGFTRNTSGALATQGRGNGIAIADYDLDGDVDVWISNWGSTVAPSLFRNDTAGNHWLKVRLVGQSSNRSGIGAKVRIRTTVDGRSVWQLRQIGGFDSAGSHELVTHFGLGSATTVDSVRIEWPSGNTQELSTTGVDQMLTITETTIPTPPTVIGHPVDTSVIEGETVVFTVSATGTAPLSYRWLRNGEELPGQNQPVLRLSPVTTQQAGTYLAFVSNEAGFIFSLPATLTVLPPPPPPPEIQSQPASQIVLTGGTVSFSVVATGSPPLSYTWLFNGSPIPNAIDAVLTLNPVTSGNAGSYRVVVRNPGGTTVSSSATLTVEMPPTPPEITLHPEDRQAPFGVTVAFSVRASGTAPLRYQWERNGIVLPGANQSDLVITGFAPGDAGTYVAVVSNDHGSARSNPAQLTYPPGEVPKISKDPTNVVVTAGDLAVFSVRANGTEPLKVQWLHNGNAIPGAVLGDYLISKTTSANAGDYQAIVSNGYGSVRSAVGTLTVLAPILPGIVTQPTGASVPAGARVAFGVTATGTPPLNFEWRVDGRVITNTPEPELVLPSVRIADSGAYTVRVANRFGSADSTPALLTVTNPPPPVLVVQPQDQAVGVGTDVLLSVSADGAPPFAYAWFVNGEALFNQTSPTLELEAVQLINVGAYYAVVSNLGGSVTSRVATVTLTNAPPGPGGSVFFANRVTGQLDAPVYLADGVQRVTGPGFVAQLYGGTSPDALTATGEPAPFRDGDGAGYWNAGASTERRIADVTPGSPAWLEVRVWALASGATYEEAANATGLRGRSKPFELVTGGFGSPPTLPPILKPLESFRLLSGPPPKITTQPANTETELGGPLALSVAATGDGLAFQWDKDGVPIARATNSTLNLSNTGIESAGGYRVVVSNIGGSTTSAVAQVTVKIRRTFDLGADVAVTEGARVTLPVRVDSDGRVGAGMIGIRFDRDRLTAPAITWAPALAQAVTQVLTPVEGEVRLVFTLPGTVIPAGLQTLATVSFRARSVPESSPTAPVLATQNLTDATGTPLTTGTQVRGTTVTVQPRTLAGDNNGNGRLDIGDASLLLRFTQLLDPAQPWDVTANDLNGSGALDGGDSLRLLRQLVHLDPSSSAGPPPLPAGEASRFALGLSPATAQPGQRVVLQVDLTTASSALSGLGFTLEYPVQALRLTDATVLKTGPLIPSTALPLWNVAPDHAFTTQTGRVHFAAAASGAWPTGGGRIAELTFEVQPGATQRHQWPVVITSSELSRDGYVLEAGGTATRLFVGRPPVEPTVGNAGPTGTGAWSMSIHGDPGLRYRVEGSEDLVTWKILETVSADAQGTASFADAAAADLAFRFYRVILAGD